MAEYLVWAPDGEELALPYTTEDGQAGAQVWRVSDQITLDCILNNGWLKFGDREKISQIMHINTLGSVDVW